MRIQTAEPKYLNAFLGIALSLTAVVIVTAILGMANVIHPYFILAAVVLCAGPAFIFMLLADKV
jgi:hypothetical protein